MPVPPAILAVRRFVSLRALMVGAVCAAVGGGAVARAQPPAKPPLVLFGDANFPPMSWIDNGQPRGLNVDVAEAVAQQMGRSLQIVLMNWNEAQIRVRNGEADGLLAMTYSQERAQSFDFAVPTLSRFYSVFVRSGDVSIQDIDDLAGKKVGVTLGGLPRTVLGQRGGLTLVLVDSYPDGFDRLAAGALDAVAADQWAAAFAIQQRGLTGIKIAGRPFASSPASMVVRKGDPLLQEIDRAVRALHDNGTLARIEAQWMPQQMVFMTREQQQRLVIIAVASVLTLLVVGLGIWVRTLKTHIRSRREAESAQFESDQRLRLALSAADMGTWHWDAPTNQSTRDAGLNRILGLDPVETTASRSEFLDHVHPEDRGAARSALDRAVVDRLPYACEYRVVRPDGTVRWLREHGRPFLDESGGIAYAAGVAVDVTEQREMQNALRRSEERFATAFRMSPDCIAISDEAGVVEINDRFEDITGFPRSHIIGRSIVDAGLVSGADVRDAFLKPLRETGSVRDYEYQVTTATGVPKTIVMSAEMIEIDGKPHFLSVNRDITAQKLAEEAVRRTEIRYRELVENANDIIFTVDRDGYCLSMNRIGQEVTGYVASDARGVNLRKLVAPEELSTVLGQLQRVMAGHDVAPFEIDVLTIEGRRITLEVGVRPLREGDTIVAAQGIARDVTTRRELEAQLRQAQKMDAIGRLAAGVAHDFNNLLTVILAHCESIAPTVKAGPVQHALNGIRVAADRAASLTGQLLAFSRRQVTQPRVLDLNDVVADIKVMTTRLIGEDIRVQFRPGDELWAVAADSGQIQQVVLNLAVNARDAMPNGGDLTIETRNVTLDGNYVQHHAQVPAGDYVMVSVSDTGIGMDPETIAHIFEPFFTTKEVGKGTGLGLATVYGIVKQSHGFVWVYSELGLGSTFKIYLPRVGERPPVAPPVVREEAGPGSETLLLVEDESDLREILEQYLSSKGYTVLSAGDGHACLAACQGRSPFPPLLITDVVMPGMSGRTLADHLRSENPSIKVLYLSGYTDDAVLRHGILPSDTHFLQKPFALHDLAAKVRHILDSPQAPRPSADLS
jgi:two-component system cell cycle sensor histidine kinase/response regulator CckA